MAALNLTRGGSAQGFLDRACAGDERLRGGSGGDADRPCRSRTFFSKGRSSLSAAGGGFSQMEAGKVQPKNFPPKRRWMNRLARGWGLTGCCKGWAKAVGAWSIWRSRRSRSAGGSP